MSAVRPPLLPPFSKKENPDATIHYTGKREEEKGRNKFPSLPPPASSSAPVLPPPFPSRGQEGKKGRGEDIF